MLSGPCENSVLSKHIYRFHCEEINDLQRQLETKNFRMLYPK